MSWLNTNTVQGRFDLVTRVQYLKYSNYYSGGAAQLRRSTSPAEADAAGGSTRAYESVNRPWLSGGARSQPAGLRGATRRHRHDHRRDLRRQRIYTLQALMLGGPDGQVM